MKKKLVLFDFDGTLLKDDSFLLFLKYSKTGWLSIIYSIFLHIDDFLIRVFQFGWKQSLKEKLLLAALQKRNAAETGRMFASYLNDNCKFHQQVYEEFKKYIEQKDEYEVWVVSASPDIWIKPWCDMHKISCICTLCEITGSHYTGRFIGKNCNRKEKGIRCDAVFGNYEKYSGVIVYGNHRKDDATLFERASVGYLVKNGVIYRIKNEKKESSYK